MHANLEPRLRVTLLATALLGGSLHGQTVREFTSANIGLFPNSTIADAIGRPGLPTGQDGVTGENYPLQLTLGRVPAPPSPEPVQQFQHYTWSSTGDNFSLQFKATTGVLTFQVGSSPPLSFSEADFAKNGLSGSFTQNSVITILARGRNTTQPANLTNLRFQLGSFATFSPGSPPNSGLLSSPKPPSTNADLQYLTVSNLVAAEDWTLTGSVVIPNYNGSAQAPRFELALTNIPLSAQLGAADFPLVIYEYNLTTNTTELKGDVIDFSSLTFDQSNDGVFNGNISGTGSVIKTGDGAVELTEAIGSNTISAERRTNGITFSFFEGTNHYTQPPVNCPLKGLNSATA